MDLRPTRRACAPLLALALGALALPAAHAQTNLTQAACQNPQEKCGGLVSRECLQSMGAGVLAAGAPEDCEGKMTAYRECLEEVAETCSVVQQNTGGGATDAERYSFEELSQLGGLIAEPDTLVEFYNNAVVYNQRGDALSARKMYEQAIAADAKAIDLHLDYLALVKAQEGLIGAREIYAGLARSHADNKTIQMIHATLLPESRREAALRALVENLDPGEDVYGPAWYEIARLYSLDRLGDQSLADKRAEKAALEAFVAADEAGDIYRWFLQKETAEEWREEARRRLAPYRNRTVDLQAVQMTATPSNDGWTIALNIAEPARAIRYSVDGAPVQDTGKLTIINQQTGAPQPRTFLTLPLKTDRAEIDVWYDDVRDQEQGPFRLTFDASGAYTAFARNVMDNMTQQWVQGREWDGGEYLVYFTHLVSYRCGIAEIAYGVNSEKPDQIYPLGDCDPENPFAISDDAQIYLTLPQPPESMVIQLTYRDGSVSALREFTF